MARCIATHFCDRSICIADVAGGQGHLRSALLQQGYQDVTTWDKRRENAKGRPGRRWGYFNADTPDRYELVVGMHPDGATDHIIRYAAVRRVPFVVCPCCIIPSAVTYWKTHAFSAWVEHLKGIAADGGMQVIETQLKMSGRNLVLIGKPIGAP